MASVETTIVARLPGRKRREGARFWKNGGRGDGDVEDTANHVTARSSARPPPMGWSLRGTAFGRSAQLGVVEASAAHPWAKTSARAIWDWCVASRSHTSRLRPPKRSFGCKRSQDRPRRLPFIAPRPAASDPSSPEGTALHGAASAVAAARSRAMRDGRRRLRLRPFRGWRGSTSRAPCGGGLRWGPSRRLREG